jgi:hypothetical protein
MTRKQSTEDPPNQEQFISDEEFLRCVALVLQDAPRKEATLVELLDAMRRKMKGVRH